jgi:hypothetical protein
MGPLESGLGMIAGRSGVQRLVKRFGETASATPLDAKQGAAAVDNKRTPRNRRA